MICHSLQCHHCLFLFQLAREMSLLGNYETASVYYQGVIQQIHRLLATIEDPQRRYKWQQIQVEIQRPTFFTSPHSSIFLVRVTLSPASYRKPIQQQCLCLSHHQVLHR